VNQNQSVLDNEPFYSFIKELVEQGEFNTSIAKKVTEEFDFPTTESAIRRFRKRHTLGVPTGEKPAVSIEGDDAWITSAPERDYKNLSDPDAMLRERGLDPEEWIIQGATVNEWEAPLAKGTKTTYHQAKLQLKRKQPECQLLPARSDGWKAPKRIPWRDPGDPYLVVITGDQQAPFHDEKLHELFCWWLDANKPAEGVLLGDTVDFPEVSKYPLDPENTATTNECIQSGYDLLRGYVESSPLTKWRKLCGNHDERLRSLILGKPSTHPLYGLKQADGETPGEKAFDLKWLLRLDELGIEYIDPSGKYDLAQINLNDNLAVRHGWIARQGSGTSALATLEHLGYSVIVGHTHRQSIVYKTKHDIDGKPTTLTAAEAGCMCKVNQTPVNGRQWPSYAPVPDWVQGFSTAVVHPDTGFFRIENATFVNDTLLWRDQVYG
jgi:hypothetical protein